MATGYSIKLCLYLVLFTSIYRTESTDLDELIFALNSSSAHLGSDTSHQDTEIRGGYDFQAVREAANLERGQGVNQGTYGNERQGYSSLTRSMDIVDTQL